MKKDTKQERIMVQEDLTIKTITEIEMMKEIKQNPQITTQNAEKDTRQEGIQIKEITVKESLTKIKIMKGIKQNPICGRTEKNIWAKEKKVIEMGEEGATNK